MKFVPGANMRNTSRLSPQHGITDGWQAVDIGAATIALYQEEIAKGETILWNGPMGVFEIPEFGEGTIAIAEAMAQLGATTIIGGGDSVTAVKQAGLAAKMTFISTGGGATLELLEGKELPGVAALSDRNSVPVRQPVSKVQVEPLAPQKPTGRKTLIRALTNTGIGAVAFLITCVGLRVVLPFPEIDGGVSQKFRFFAAHKDEFDTLFIGSSRVYFQISPAIFDRVTRESGMPTHSFNFGIGGMYLPETAYLLEQILKLKPRNLRWVFIEYDELQTKWSPENQTSRRALYWADWKRVPLLLRKLTDAGTDPFWLPNPAKLRDIILRQKDEKNTRSLLTFYAGQFEKNYTNVARAADVLQPFRRSRHKGTSRELPGRGQ